MQRNQFLLQSYDKKTYELVFHIMCKFHANLPKICKSSLPHFLDRIERAVNSHAGGTTTYKSIRI